MTLGLQWLQIDDWARNPSFQHCTLTKLLTRLPIVAQCLRRLFSPPQERSHSPAANYTAEWLHIHTRPLRTRAPAPASASARADRGAPDSAASTLRSLCSRSARLLPANRSPSASSSGASPPRYGFVRAAPLLVVCFLGRAGSRLQRGIALFALGRRIRRWVVF
jgi:hypothetical protein